MRTLIVIPNYYDVNNGGRYYEMPLGLAYINAAFRNEGMDVECLNMNHLEGDIYQKLVDRILEKEIDVVISGAITPFYPQLKKIFSTAKNTKPEIITIGGGGAVSSEPVAFSEMVDIDYGVIGEGDITDVELVKVLEGGGDITSVKGIVYKTDEGYKMTAERQPIDDLDSLPFPCYDGFDVEVYLERQNVSDTYYTYYTDNPRVMPMTLARSCPYQCKFCFHPVGNKYRTRSLDNFFEELDGLVEKYQINGVLILDELFSASIEKVYEFCKRMKPYHLHWLVQMRVDIISEELLQTMKDAGCYTISYGLESFSSVVLQNMKKHISPEDIEKALELTYKIGIDIQGNFIFGDEKEDWHTIYETIGWWLKHPKYNINLSQIETYPGTGYYKECLKNGKITDVKKFIEEGKYIVNLTEMNDKQYTTLIIVISILRYYYNQAVTGEVLDLYVKDGKNVLVTKCAHCGAVNTYVGMEGRNFSTLFFKMGCRECNQRSAYFTVIPEEMPNYDKLEYLCRMLANAENEKDFGQAIENLELLYMMVRDNEKPFPI